ncbi:MAG: helix-turn-helix domain-containing protein [Nocardioidaceae bacterium]
MTTTEFVGLPDANERPTLTVWPEVAGILGLSKASAYAAVERGEIPALRIGRRLLVPTAALRRMLQLDSVGVGGPDAA